MFVAATLYCAAGSCPVHIRNMSPSGALVEGAALPEQDAAVTLRRGSLRVEATVMWKSNRRAGIAFGGAVRVADWMSRNPPSHQAQVDEMVRGIRAGGSVADPAPPMSMSPSLEDELRALKAELVQLETGLTRDMAVVAAHPEMQLLDIALQRVEGLLNGRRGC
jgi:hypothetical protein